MASFTDQIPQFNPYIQQLPVEAMVAVGMEKQKRYDEGIQKIQSEIDKVAGMDIYRDVDRSYLQSKLNELGNNLKTVAAGDYSNFQLVNSVSGMANQIGKDPIVENAVKSTAWYRKQAAEMEKAIAEGKSSVQNQWEFGQKVNNWLTSDKAGELFSDRYTPYIDVNKKWLDALKSINPNLKEQDIPYELDPVTGQPDYNKIAAAMQRVSTEKVSASQIENVLRATLTPDDLNQLSINGRYQFREYTPENLVTYTNNKYESQLKTIDSRIELLKGIANTSSSDPNEKDLALKTIQDLEARKDKIRMDRDEEIDYVRTNPEEAKATIYKNSAIAQFADSFSWEKSKINALENPVLKAKHWEQEFALNQSKFNLNKAEFSWKQFKDRHDMALADAEYKLKFEKQQIELFGAGTSFTTYGGQSTNVKDPVTAMKSDAIDKEQAANNTINRMVKAVPNTTAALWETKIAQYQNGNINAIPVDWRDDVDALLANRRDAARLNKAIQQAETNATNSPEILAEKKKLEQDLRTLPTLKIGNVTFSQKEIVDYLNKEKYQANVSGTGGGAPGKVSVDLSKLTSKERILYNWRQTGSSTSPDGQVISSTLRKYNDVVNKNRNIVNKINERVYNELLDKTGAYIPMISDIVVTDKDGAMSRDRYENIAMSSLLKFDSDIAGVSGGAERLSKNEVKEAREWLAGKDKKNIQFKRLVQGDTTYLVLVKGSEEKFIPLTPEEASQIATSPNEPSYIQKQVTIAQHLGGGNTNVTGTPAGSMFQRNNFSNLRTLSATADLQWNQSNRSKNYININLKLPSGYKNLQLDNNPMDVRQAIQFINTATDEDLMELYLKDPRVPESWKEEIRKLK